MDIDEFLAAQKASGKVESEGAVFTISVEKARQKLGKFQLDDPSFYLLKVVQAAVACGATRIDLRTSRSKLALWFDSDLPLAPFDQVLGALRNPLEVANGPLKLFALGFNASLFSKPPQVSFVWWGDGESHAMVASGDELASTPAPERPAGISSSNNLYLFSVTKAKTTFFSNDTAAEHAAVCAYCSFCPIEFRIDGHPLDGGRPSAAANEPWLTSYSEPFHLVERIDPDDAGGVRMRLPNMRGRVAGKTGWLRGNRLPETFCVQPPLPKPMPAALRTRGAYALPLALRGTDKIAVVCHGVKVATVAVGEAGKGAGAWAVVCGDDLLYDLSGFSLMRDPRNEAMVSSTVAAWAELAQSVRPDLEQLKGTITEEERKVNDGRHKQSLGCATLGCFGSLFFLANLPAMMGEMTALATAMGILGGGAWPLLRKKDDPHQGLRDVVLRRLDELRGHWRS